MTEAKPKKEKKVTHRKKMSRRIMAGVLSVLMISAIGYFVWQISKEVETTFTLLTDINEAKKELEDLKAEQQNLTQQKEQLLDDNYVKTWARGEFLITKEGEEIYRLPAQSK